MEPPVPLQQRDHLVKLKEAPRPPVDQQQRRRVAAGRPDMLEVDVDSVDGAKELGVRVQLGLPAAPVVGRAPVGKELLVVAVGGGSSGVGGEGEAAHAALHRGRGLRGSSDVVQCCNGSKTQAVQLAAGSGAAAAGRR